jgi:hypothetical protein
MSTLGAAEVARRADEVLAPIFEALDEKNPIALRLEAAQMVIELDDRAHTRGKREPPSSAESEEQLSCEELWQYVLSVLERAKARRATDASGKDGRAVPPTVSRQ